MLRVSTVLSRAALGALLLAAACGSRATTRGRAPAESPPRAPPASSGAPPPAEPAPVAPAASSAGTAAPAAEASNEQAVANFYRGKTIRIVVGFAPGGGFDTYARLIAKYLPKYMPGRPTVIVENVAGAASIVAANQVYKT